MAGRELAFSDLAIVRMASDDFVPVAADDWYQRRREDAEGEFFRSVADQGPRKGQGGSTRQGIYCFTASGKLLAYKNAQNAEVMREVLEEALARWTRRPSAEREPDAIRVPDLGPGDVDLRYARTPPEGGLVVNVYTRVLDRDRKGELCLPSGECSTPGGFAAARDHLWITSREWRDVVGQAQKVGDVFPLPGRVAERIARFHLVDNTRGEPPHWDADEIRRLEVELTVEEFSKDRVELSVSGVVLLATDAEADQAERGYEARLAGRIGFDRMADRFDRFDLVAAGEHWGQGTYTGGARPGRTPLGVAFELARRDRPSDLIPPQGSRWLEGYIPRER